MKRGPGPRSLASRIQDSNSQQRKAEQSLVEPEVAPLVIQPLGRHKHVEKLLDVSPNTVDKLIKEGLPAIRLGGQLRFDLEAVRAWALRRQIRTRDASSLGSGGAA
jgi:excisionase family DNA binding protein